MGSSDKRRLRNSEKLFVVWETQIDERKTPKRYESSGNCEDYFLAGEQFKEDILQAGKC